jgi:hypothetical protein
MATIGPELDEGSFFEIFSAEQVLKDYDLSYDEIEDGIVDMAGDGGIDSIYFFINDSLYQEDSDYASLKKGVRLKLVFIQSKVSQGYSESGIEKLISAIRDLLDLNKDIRSLSKVYNKALLGKIRSFRETYIELTSKFPELSLSFFYVTKGMQVHENVNRKVSVLEQTAKGLFTPCAFSFGFVGASNLLSLARQAPSTSHQLKLIENPISPGQIAYVCLVNLRDYFSFITDSSGKLKKSIFEGNVRDYQGKTEVNEHIAKTLGNPNREDFWWLNNGVTIICNNATLSGKTLTIEDPEIVNGLQTSNEVYGHYSSMSSGTDSRTILVRVIKPEDESSRDRIIRATNSQTSIPVASLRATDKIHRDIEDYLQTHGLFYDRRKNHYKNLGKPIKNIISIPYMAQAVLACALLDPSNARGRPSSLLKDDTSYMKIFNADYPINLYLVSAQITRRVESFLRSDSVKLDSSEINNLKYYLAMLVACKLSGIPRPKPSNIAEIKVENASEDLLATCLSTVKEVYRSLGSTDLVAKGKDFGPKLLEKHVSETTPVLKTKTKKKP